VTGVQASDTEWTTGATPAPENEIIAGELVALLDTVTLPLKFPTPEGEKVTCKAVLCPGARIKPAEIPVAANLGPETLTPEMVTIELPAFMSVTFKITDTSPVTAPLVFGANTIDKVDCFPAPMVMGRAGPEIVNPLAEVLAWVTMSAEPPVLDMVTD
jgi:hypothetical protein